MDRMNIELRGGDERQVRRLSHLNGTNNAFETVKKALALYESFLTHKQSERKIMIIYSDGKEKSFGECIS